VGLHGYSDTKIDGRNFDIPFAFGSHFGAGLRFGPGAHFEVMYRYQHQSNAGLGDDNPGINFHLVSLGYHF
jgi:Lipid A 3-O-deacylase (PagL)